MELEHSFEIPVGIDTAWTHLLDMDKVAACFPGATLTSTDGDEYSGTVKVKLGPIQLTYQGAARIVSADETTHTARIEASGNAARSGSTANMKVVAVASVVDETRTAVLLNTDLSITGRPAQFGRGVMVEVGNKILSTFADCLASSLTVGADSDAGDGDRDAGDGDRDAGDGDRASRHATPSPTTAGAAHGPAPIRADNKAGEDADGAASIDLLAAARGPIIKRALPLLAGLGMLWLWRRLRRRSRSGRPRGKRS